MALTPAQAGIQLLPQWLRSLDSGIRRNDEINTLVQVLWVQVLWVQVLWVQVLCLSQCHSERRD